MHHRLRLLTVLCVTLPTAADATTEVLDFSIEVNNSLSDFAISLALVDNSLGLTGSATLVPASFDILGTVTGQIYRDVETQEVTFVDTLSADLGLTDFGSETSEYAIEGSLGAGGISAEVEGTVDNLSIFSLGPTGPQPVGSPFDATLAFGNRGFVDVDILLPALLGGRTDIFTGDLEDANSTFTIPFEGAVLPNTTFPFPDLFEIEYSFDGRIEIIELPIPGGGTAVMDVTATIRTNLFQAQSSGFIPDPGGVPAIPGPLPLVSLLSALGLVALLRRRAG